MENANLYLICRIHEWERGMTDYRGAQFRRHPVQKVQIKSGRKCLATTFKNCLRQSASHHRRQKSSASSVQQATYPLLSELNTSSRRCATSANSLDIQPVLSSARQTTPQSSRQLALSIYPEPHADHDPSSPLYSSSSSSLFKLLIHNSSWITPETRAHG